MLPYSEKFSEAFAAYCEQTSSFNQSTHHDQRRSLLLNFLREGFGIEATEVELERKIKADEVRGRIDIFWRHLIIEVKTDMERERADARDELKKYFEAQQETLNFNGKLTSQKFRAKFVVLYNKSGTNLSAAMLTPKETKKIGGIAIKGFVADNVCYRYSAASEEEAAFLVGILNSSAVNEAIKPYQPEGLMGERDIHRRPFEACAIPLFDANCEALVSKLG